MSSITTDLVSMESKEKKPYVNRLILAILYALQQNSSEEAPLFLHDLGWRIFGDSDYKAHKGDRNKSIQRAILECREAFEGNDRLTELFPLAEIGGFQGKRSQWQVYYKNNLTETQLSTLFLALLQSKQWGDEGMGDLIEVLVRQAGMENDKAVLTRLSALTLTEVHRESIQQTPVTSQWNTIEFLFHAISPINESKKKISFQLYGFDAKGERSLFRQGYLYKVTPLYLAVHQGRFWLIGITSSYKTPSFYPLDLMGDLQSVEEEALSTDCLDDWEHQEKVFLEEHMNLSYDKPCYAHLKVKTTLEDGKENLPAFTRIYNTFGKNIQQCLDIAEKLGENWTVFRVKRSPHGLINWIFENHSHVELILDDKLLDKDFQEDTLAFRKQIAKKLDELNRQYPNLK